MGSNTTDTIAPELPTCPHCELLEADVRRLEAALRMVGDTVSVGLSSATGTFVQGEE